MVLETWRDGKQYEVFRDAKGRFIKAPSILPEVARMPEAVRVEVEPEPEVEPEECFRITFAVNNIPVASTKARPNYKSFRYQAWELLETDIIFSVHRDRFIRELGEALGSKPYADEVWEQYCTIGGSIESVEYEKDSIGTWEFVQE